MQRYLVILLLLLSACSNKQLRDQDCKQFRNGKFKMTYEGRTTIITRHDSVQIEELNDPKVTLTFKVKWKHDCSYVLTNSPEDVKKYPQMKKNGFVLVTITSVGTKSYSQTSTSNISDKVINGEVIKID